MTRITERIEFASARGLVEAIDKLSGGLIDLQTIYIKDCDGNALGVAELEQLTLSDGSIAFNLILSEYRDPNS